ncbi:MAG: futalosine hydrolase [Bacteroidota bacterium]
MKLLIVAATEAEIGPFLEDRENAGADAAAEVLITGVGMVATTYALTKHLQACKYDLVLQVGIGGSFDKSIEPGSLVFVNSDRYGDLGAEDHDNYIDIFEMGLMDKDSHPHSKGMLTNPISPVCEHITLPKTNGLTVNTVSGNERTIQQRTDRYGCAVESMEGAAFHYVCLREGIAFAQVRAISNYVTPRDKSQWRMQDAISNLNKWLAVFAAEAAQRP